MYPTSTCKFHFRAYIYNICTGILCCTVAFQMHILTQAFNPYGTEWKLHFCNRCQAHGQIYEHINCSIFTDMNMPGHNSSYSSIYNSCTSFYA